MRAFYANGVDRMHIPWAVEGLPALLHLSLFLFFGGLIIFLFHVDREVFTCVVWWIGFFSMVYGLITLLPLIRQDSPYNSPLSVPAWFLCAGIQYVTFTVLAPITYSCGWYRIWRRFYVLMVHNRRWMLGSVEKKAEEIASEQSSKIDIEILGWTISALGDDDSLEKFIEAIPGFFNSKLVKDLREHLPDDVSSRLLVVLRGFLYRTLSSNSVVDSVKLHRLDISLSALNLIPNFRISSIFTNIFFHHQDQVPKTVKIWHTLEPWCTSNSRVAQYAQSIVAKVLWAVQKRDDHWVEAAARVYGLPERDIRDILSYDDDSVSLAILIQAARKAFCSDLDWDVLRAFTRIDVCNARYGLKHDFCTLWNEMVREAKKQGPYSLPVRILRRIRHHYIALHQGTDALLTAFSPSTHSLDLVVWQPSSYPLCDIVSHRPDAIAHSCVPVPTQPVHSPDPSPDHSTSGGSNVSREVNEAIIVARPPSPSHPTSGGIGPIPSGVGDSSQGHAVTSHASRVHTDPCPTDASPRGAVAAALQDTPPTATLSHSMEGTTQRDIVAPCTEPDIAETLSTASLLAPAPAPTPTLVPVPASTPLLIKSLEPCNAGAASISNPLLSASSVSIPASLPPFRVPLLPNAESLALLSNTTPSRSTGNATMPRLRARGLMNTGSMCFANAVMQLLVHSPPFWDLFGELGDLKRQRGAGILDGGTPLIDATLKFFQEFMFKEKQPPQEPPQQDAGGKMREDEETKNTFYAVDWFESMYMYDAMKEKRQLKKLLVRFRATCRTHCWY